MKCFVMMPIKSSLESVKWKNILDKIIRPAILSFDPKIEVVRVDELPGTGNWLRKIVEHTHEARIVIADLTTSNPNVMWELGLRHGVEKTGTIMITQNINEVPSDLLSYNVISYNEDQSDFEIFKDRIHAALNEIFSSDPKTDSPFFDYIGNIGGRVRDFKVRLQADGQEIELSKINLPLKDFFEPKPFKSESDYFNEFQVIPNDSGYDLAELENYHKKLRNWAKEYPKKEIEAWVSKRANAQAVKIDLFCSNLSEVQADDVHIEFQFNGDIELLEELPREVPVPVKPKAPKHIHQKQMSGLNALLGFQEHFKNITMMQPYSLIETPRLLNSNFDGCWIEGQIVIYHSQKIRQHSERGDWRPFYILPHEKFSHAEVKILIRAKNIRGIQEIKVPIYFT